MLDFFKRIKARLTRTVSYEIDYEALKNMKKRDGNVWLIDVRTLDEYRYRHLEDAINIPLQDVDGEIQKVVTNKNDVVIVYCEYGSRSQKAYIKLKRLGYINVYNLKDGIAGVLGTRKR